MSDRLNELQHQRALLQEHLAWLEREIAATRGGGGAAPSTPPGEMSAGQPQSPAPLQWQAPGRVAPASLPAPTSATRDAAGIIERYRDESKSVKQDVRKGCFLYFALAFVLLGAALVALYFYTASHHPSGIVR